ncbi:MAG: site-specific integrase [Acetatifactor sp.]|nr:site-specific integrase [Acetatifactor sp.]
MTIEKLKGNKWRAVIMKDGKRYRITYDYKPQKKQAEADLYELISKDGDVSNKGMTFKTASASYVDMKRNVLSPNTVRDYSLMCNRLPEWFVNTKIDSITQVTINKVINDLSLRLSPKTIRNVHGFISAVLGTFRPNMKIYTTLPQKRKNEVYIPTDNEVKQLIKYFEGTAFYIPIILGCYGMRRGEICALLPSDIEGDVVHITKAVAIDENRNLVEKGTKTTDSERDIIISSDIADLIRKQGYVYKGYPGSINRALAKAQERLGIEHFPFHKLRHYFASKMLTITDTKTVQALGGWKTDAVMKTVYAHSMKEEQERAKREAVNRLNASIF